MGEIRDELLALARGEGCEEEEMKKQPCDWCVVQGRCCDSKVFHWSEKGKHEQPCACSCHGRQR